MLREGHLEATPHMFSFLKSHSKSRLIFDLQEPDFGGSPFVECDWTDFYAGAVEAIQHTASKPLTKGAMLCMFTDSNHAGDLVSQQSQCSQTGVIFFLNHGMIDRHSKKQSNIETSVFGVEFCAMKHGIEMLCGIHYKLRMTGVPVAGPSYVFGDNTLVVTNVRKPESTLRKKSTAICYYAVREAVAMGKALVADIPTQSNLADLFPKVLYGSHVQFLIPWMLWYVYLLVECQWQPSKECR